MSVSIVDHREIDILAKAIVKYKVDFRSDDYLRSVCSKTEIGQSLVNQNYRSVNERYEENTIPPQYKFKDVYFDDGELFQVINHYENQTYCVPNYFQSKLHFSLSRLKDKILMKYLHKENLLSDEYMFINRSY